MVRVEIDQNSGFCFGVVYAIEMAEEFLESKGTLYCLGDIVHNDMEVERLEKKGLKIIDHEDLKNIRDTTVLIRAHGEPPETYQIALQNNIELIDASCPVVLKLQHRVRMAHDRKDTIVIYGKPGHAEVNGLIGQTGKEAIVITEEADVDRLDYSKPVSLFSQTTKSTEKFYRIAALMAEKTEQMKANDTICRQVSNREPDLKIFSRKFDIIIFVAGRKSSNGKVLYETCKSVNEKTYFVSEPQEIEMEWLQGASSVGICGATSTPMWLMEQTADFIRNKES